MSEMNELESLKRNAEIASRSLFRANVFFELWWQSAGVEGRREFKEFWDEHWEFWRFNEHAMQFTFVVYAASLFERRSNTVNFGQLWDKAQNYTQDESLKKEFASLWGSTQPIAKSVLILRSNVMAHRSTKLSYTDAFKKANVTPDQLREFLENSWRLLNLIEISLGIDLTEFEPNAVESLRRLANSKLVRFEI